VVEDATQRVARSDKECVPCNDKGCDGMERSICLEELGADTVMKRIEEVLHAIGSGQGRDPSEPSSGTYRSGVHTRDGK